MFDVRLVCQQHHVAPEELRESQLLNITGDETCVKPAAGILHAARHTRSPADVWRGEPSVRSNAVETLAGFLNPDHHHTDRVCDEGQ